MIRPTPQSDADELLAANRPPRRDSDAPPILVLVQVVRRGLRLVLVAVAIAVAIAVAWTVLTPAQFTARSVVRIPPPAQDGAGVVAVPNPAEFQPILLNRQSVAAVLTARQLDKRWTPDQFIDQACALDVAKGSAIANVQVTMDDPVLAAAIANELVQKGIELSRKLSQEEGSTARDQFDQVVQGLAKDLDLAREKFVAYRSSAQIEALRAEVTQLVDDKASLIDLTTQIAQQGAQLERARAERDARPQTLATEKSLSSDPALQEAVRDAAGRSVLGLKVSEQSINQVRQDFDLQVGSLTSDLAGLEKRRSELVGRLGLGGPTLAKLNLLYEREAELARLQLEYDLSARAYQDAVAHLRSLGGDVMRRKSEIQLVDKAIAPSKRNSRGFLTKMVIALAGMLTCAAFVMAWREARRYERA